jgi:hypothetical protein
MTKTDTYHDPAVVQAAEQVAARAISELLGPGPRPRAVVLSAPAGAGKSQTVIDAAGRARARGLRVAVASPTNEQTVGLVRRAWELHARHVPGERVSYCPATGRTLPDEVRALPGVEEVTAPEASSRALVVATLAKLGDAFGRRKLAPFDVLLVDESYQADAARYFAAAGLAPLHLLVGDSGQISPFATIADPHRWRGLPEDPLQTAVGVLLRNHPRTAVNGLPITRRLDDRAAGIARHFYPALSFAAAVRPGVRQLALGPGRRTPVDRALELAARHGWADVRLPRAPVLPADPEAIERIVEIVARLFSRDARVRCERQTGLAPLRPAQVAVGVSHNDQKDLLRSALAGRGLAGVVVETANRLQGLEYEVVVAWHPLAGLSEPDGFHLDPGRLCVLLTRHRQVCILVGREGDEEMLEDEVPPSTPAYLGCTADPSGCTSCARATRARSPVVTAWSPARAMCSKAIRGWISLTCRASSPLPAWRRSSTTSRSSRSSTTSTPATARRLGCWSGSGRNCPVPGWWPTTRPAQSRCRQPWRQRPWTMAAAS